MAPVVYLVTGANRQRGIGFAIVQAIAALDNTVVFAGVRDLKDRAALDELAATSANKIHVLKVVSADLENNKVAVEEIKRIAGRLDVVIANAATGFGYKSSLETPLQDVQDHFTVNVVGPLALFQATYPLLKASTSTPRFVPISSTMGSIELGTKVPTDQMPYGVSKAALNWLTAKLRNEHEGLVAFPICPGPVASDLADIAVAAIPNFDTMMEQMGLKRVPASKVAPGIVKLVNEGTRETNFLDQDGTTVPW